MQPKSANFPAKSTPKTKKCRQLFAFRPFWSLLLSEMAHRSKIAASEPKALTKLGLDKNHWTTRVKGIGSGYWRVVGELEELLDKAQKLANARYLALALRGF